MQIGNGWDISKGWDFIVYVEKIPYPFNFRLNKQSVQDQQIEEHFS